MNKPVIGVDLGATNIRAATVAADGSCGPLKRHEIRDETSPEAVADALAALAREVSGKARPAAVGIGLAGWLDSEGKVVRNGPNLGWRDVPFWQLVADRLPRTGVVLTNDLRAIAQGEYLFGGGFGSRILAVVFMGSGIGSCVMIDGVPLSGTTNMACEIGHIRVVPRNGRACGCGQRGCLEAYVGGHNLERRVRHDLETGISTTILDLAGGDPRAITGATIEQAAAGGDPYALDLWCEAADYLGQALGSLVTYFNPDRLVLGGGLWQGAQTLRRLVKARISQMSSPAALDACLVADPKLGDRAGILGAAALARRSLEKKHE
jgi:glucokinase